MQTRKGWLLFSLLLVCAGTFVCFTSSHLPMLVASHFESSGTVNGLMPHDAYVYFMLGLVVVLPAAMTLLTSFAIASPNARINLPNKEYWLAPARRAETINYLSSGMRFCGIMLVAFLCYVHWLVVLSNAAQPAHLANSWFIGGLVVFIVALCIWLKLLFGHFQKVSRPLVTTDMRP